MICLSELCLSTPLQLFETDRASNRWAISFFMKKALNLKKIPLFSSIVLFLLIVTTPVLSLSSDWVINDKSKVRPKRCLKD